MIKPTNVWNGMPARLYVIDKEGNVAYKSGRGPFGYKPEAPASASSCMGLVGEVQTNYER